MTLCHRPQRSHPLAVCPAPVANFLADRKDPSDGQAARRTPSHASIRKESQTRRVEDLEEPVSVEGLRPAPGHANGPHQTCARPYLPMPLGLPLPGRNGRAPPHIETHHASLFFFLSVSPLSWACCSSRSRRSSFSCRSSCTLPAALLVGAQLCQLCQL